MGSYLKTHRQYADTLGQEKPKQIKPPEKESELHRVVASILAVVYGPENIVSPKTIGDHKFLAAQQSLVFDLATSPLTIDPVKIKAALTNNYNTEVIYLVPDRILTSHSQIKYRNLAEYVKIVQANHHSDLVRWINQFRNKAEADYERRKKTKSIFAQSKDVENERAIR